MDQREDDVIRRVTVRDFRAMRRRHERIAMITAYDYPTAMAADAAGVTAILVGDSLGTAVLGLETTVPVTLDIIIHHTRAVVRGARRAMVVADLPFMSYQPSVETAVRSAGRLLQEGGATAVKLEGGKSVTESIRRIVDAGIPVMGHLGLTPQSVHRLGGYRLQGRSAGAARQLIDDARCLQAAGAFALVLELVPGWLAGEVTAALRIPTVGIGAGPECSGQIQVLADLVGLDPVRTPRHAQKYANLGAQMRQAIEAYAQDVKAGRFPTSEQYQVGSRPAGFTAAAADMDSAAARDEEIDE
ncbi:MAG TPA: 3-methyl-2-oxobutanoate hydroxymethyltransferase [Chloroflexota bacterium]|jgi:3-methyl-2-oxobutanoate hydroxymethyltransferase|nr:3-methyl-2-oxobutanoate hydroxymethyltransferase [Chloroflexota bacterium]